ncbi:MAG: 16S rRNA (guanine(527)-N(7))-methyltransferase RsmG [Flavobacteriales bacterium]|jgi:16S rRNA (guanine527-N7)-methyltransferase|nr:16S rRNA (guanine(527)-N(7))-methyltransferase RsmG [Flavobacteriales bacterium]|tara:strand:- start:241 stop:861 length:621 start_codon:yes stop_codon:yes gene_type:complete
MENIVYKYFDVSSSQKSKIDLMLNVYSFWNDKINLISRKDFSYFYERHVLHSLSIAKVFDFVDDTKIMDLGTGGGFPGVPLAIMFPNVDFLLVDSINKKTKALKEIVKELNLHNASVVNQRAEHVDGSFDFVVCRAVAKLNQLKSFTKGKILNKHNHSFKNGLICLKGGNLATEINQHQNNLEVFSIGDFFEEDFFKEKKIIYLHK